MEILFKTVVVISIAMMLFTLVEMSHANKEKHAVAADAHAELKSKVERFIVDHIPVKGRK